MSQTHVLVIGVGDYPYLSRGTLYKPKTLTLGLGQLTSPQLSANAFYQWVTNDFDNPRAPLGYRELIVSDGYGAANFSAIKAAFKRWYAACDQDPDNVGVFYFCGHGFRHDNKDLILAEDFGADPDTAFENAIDFGTTWYGMYECRAKTQLYVLDACREEPFSALKAKGNPRELKSYEGTTYERDGRVLQSASEGKKAFGDANTVSFFTTQLLRALEGYGADRNDSGRWWLSTGSLARALGLASQWLKRPGVRFSAGGYPADFETDIHIVKQPKVLASITCQPEAALHFASLSLNGNEASYSRSPEPRRWDVEASQGSYDLAVTFTDPACGYRNASVSVPLNPQRFTWTLDV